MVAARAASGSASRSPWSRPGSTSSRRGARCGAAARVCSSLHGGSTRVAPAGRERGRGEISAGRQSLKLRLTPSLRCCFDHRDYRQERHPWKCFPTCCWLSDDEQSDADRAARGRRGRDLAPAPGAARPDRHSPSGAHRAAQGAGRRRELRATPPKYLDRPIFEGTGDIPDEEDLDAAARPRDLDDDALCAEIRRLEQEEDDVSLNRRVMQAQIDIVRAERAKRRAAGDHVDAGRSRLDPRRRAMSHVYCPECGFQSPEAATYCSRCGALLVRESVGETTLSLGPEDVERRANEPRASTGRRSSCGRAAAGRGRASRRSASAR